MILADKIIKLRRQSGFSQEELAARLNVSRQSVSKWESGTSIPDLNKIIKLSEIFGVSTDYLLKGQKDLALLEFRKLCINKHYLEILAVLQTNFTKLTSIKIESATLSPFEIASRNHLPEFIVKKHLEKLRTVPVDRLIKIRKNLLEAEYRVKTGEMAFYELPVEMALLD